MNNTISIRPCQPGDEYALALVGKTTFLASLAGQVAKNDILQHCAHQHSVVLYRHWLEDSAMKLWLAEVEPGGAPVGYLVMGPSPRPSQDIEVEIKRFYLIHRFLGMQLGRRLMNEAMLYGRRIGAARVILGVYVRNRAGIAFYRRYGYVADGSRIFQVNGTAFENHLMTYSLKDRTTRPLPGRN